MYTYIYIYTTKYNNIYTTTIVLKTHIFLIRPRR